MKKMIVGLVCLWALAAMSFAGVTLDDQVVFGKVITLSERNEMLGGIQRQQLPFVPARLDEGVRIFSACASSSTNVIANRANTIGWMAGAPVRMDRNINPAACWPIPSDGLQWYDLIVTGYPSWMGSTVMDHMVANENGHRMVVSCAGKAPVSNYWCQITSSTPIMGSAYFQVGVYSGTTNEIPFNLNFVGLYFGTNGVMESFYDTTLGHWVQVGDDKVYVNGELPSQVPHTWWYRFGATVHYTAPLPGDVKVVKDAFVAKTNWLSAELVVPTLGTNGIGGFTVTEAQPTLDLKRSGLQVSLKIAGGQVGIPYAILTTTNLESPVVWYPYLPGQVFYTGMVLEHSPASEQQYFRLMGVSP